MGLNSMKKICLVSSTGGHFAQLNQIIPIIEKFDYFIVTEKSEMSNNEKNKSYYLKQQERKNILFFFYIAYNTIISLLILARERPSLILTTGAGAVIPLCILGKLFGAKLIFIESFAKVKTPTITGRILYRLSNRFYVQWEELLEVYPKAIYKGALY